MAIPELTVSGLLPPGIHDTTLAEIGEVFGRFQRSDRRMLLFERLSQYVAELRAWGNAQEVLIDGSFASDKDEPGDIDLIVVYPAAFNFEELFVPAEYNVISRRRVRAVYGFDSIPVRSGSRQQRVWLDFFLTDPRIGVEMKGVLRIRL